MAASKTLHGARCQLFIDGAIVGLFNSVSYGVTYDAIPINVLGNFAASEILLAGMEPVSVTAGGFRVLDNGPYAAGKVPKLQDLLNVGEITLSLFDRQSGKFIMTVVGVKATGFSNSVSARGVMDLTVNFMGLRLSDETGDQDESPGHTNF